MPLIMLVDDTEVERAAVRCVLEREGYATIEAEDGLDAIALLDGSRPHLILLDLSMPDLDGLALLHFVRDDVRWRSIPVVVVTGWDDPQLLDEARRVGARECLLKSHVSVEAILDAVQRHVTNPAGTASTHPAATVV